MIIEHMEVVERCKCSRCPRVDRCVVYTTYTLAQKLDGPTVEHAEARVTAKLAICRSCTEKQLAAFRRANKPPPGY